MEVDNGGETPRKSKQSKRPVVVSPSTDDQHTRRQRVSSIGGSVEEVPDVLPDPVCPLLTSNDSRFTFPDREPVARARSIVSNACLRQIQRKRPSHALTAPLRSSSAFPWHLGHRQSKTHKWPSLKSGLLLVCFHFRIPSHISTPLRCCGGGNGSNPG
jgi:hypothetical protein